MGIPLFCAVSTPYGGADEVIYQHRIRAKSGITTIIINPMFIVVGMIYGSHLTLRGIGLMCLFFQFFLSNTQLMLQLKSAMFVLFCAKLDVSHVPSKMVDWDAFLTDKYVNMWMLWIYRIAATSCLNVLCYFECDKSWFCYLSFQIKKRNAQFFRFRVTPSHETRTRYVFTSEKQWYAVNLIRPLVTNRYHLAGSENISLRAKRFISWMNCVGGRVLLVWRIQLFR